MARDLNSYIKDGVEYINKSIKIQIIRQIAEGIEDLQTANLIHGDIKPQNILLDENFNVKIADFGTVALK